jgi:N-formylglutamate deformylase
LTLCPVLHIPHSSVVVPDDCRSDIELSDDLLERELRSVTDWYTDELFSFPLTEAIAIRYPVSRVVVDPERFLDDAEEPMAVKGQGVIYTRTSAGGRLRCIPSLHERNRLIARFYVPHHARLSAAVDSSLAQCGRCLVVDCHSFPSRALPCDQYLGPVRPDVCIGTDSVHTPPWLVDLARERFAGAGFRVAVDCPYAGALVPAKHMGNTSVAAVMLEVNRNLYMNEQTAMKLVAFESLAAFLRGTIRDLVDAVTRLP